MTERPLPRLNPDALKDERRDVDLGTTEESEHNHVGREPGHAPNGGEDSLSQPTSGATPPAR